MYSCSKLLKVAGVGGETLPYRGYVEASVSIPTGSSGNFTLTIPILVAPDTEYNTMVPLLIGTNFLCRMSKEFTTASEPPVPVQVALGVIRQQEEYLSSTNGIYGDVSMENDVLLPCRSAVVYTAAN